LDKKRVEVNFCEGCKTKQLIMSIDGLFLKLVQLKEMYYKKSRLENKSIELVKEKNCEIKINLNEKINFLNEPSYVFEDGIDDINFNGLDIDKIFLFKDKYFICMKIEKIGNKYPNLEKISLWFHFESLDIKFVNFSLNVYIDNYGKYHFNLVDKSNSNFQRDKKWNIITNNITSKITEKNIFVAIPINSLNLSNKYRFKFFTHHTIGGKYLNNNGDRNKDIYFIEFK